MKIAIFTILLPALFMAGCGYGSNYNPGSMMQGNLSISQLAPNTVIAGSDNFELTVNGSGFTSNSVVYWNMVPHSARLVSANQLMTSISNTDIANPGTVSVYVRSNNQNSNTVTFTVD